MNLNIFNNLINTLKKDESTQDFLNELKDSIENPLKNNLGILDKFQSENKVSIGTKNKMESKMDEILKNYAQENEYKGELLFIVEKSKKDNTYVTYKYENQDDSVIKIPEEELPEEASINSVLRMENGKYILDEEGTLELENRITTMANELLDEQNKILEDYRKEGHLYEVSENINGSVFLHDITDNPNFEVEEVNFPEELLIKATEGAIFQYIDGKYEFKGEEE